jgi:hypothetical protein
LLSGRSARAGALAVVPIELLATLRAILLIAGAFIICAAFRR